MPTQITPEWLASVGFSAAPVAPLWFRRTHDSAGSVHVNTASGNAVLETDMDDMTVHVGGSQERLRSLWFAFTGQHLEHADGDDALVLLDAIEEGRDLTGLTHAVPVVRAGSQNER